MVKNAVSPSPPLYEARNVGHFSDTLAMFSKLCKSFAFSLNFRINLYSRNEIINASSKSVKSKMIKIMIPKKFSENKFHDNVERSVEGEIYIGHIGGSTLE